MLEAGIEQQTVKDLLDRIQAGGVDEMRLSAMIKVMNEYVNHHVNEVNRGRSQGVGLRCYRADPSR